MLLSPPVITRIAPQKGPQEAFLACTADICIYGGAAGAGKTYGALLEALRHIDNKHAGTVIFRRSYPEITNEGGLWDEASELFAHFGARLNNSDHEAIFPSGYKVSFKHLQYEKTVFSWHGAQIPLILFDELTHFTKQQFFYLMSRNRSAKCGFRPYVRASCNPDPDSFVALMIEWWIDQDSGFPIQDRSGVVRYFVHEGGLLKWGATREEAIEQSINPKIAEPKSFTFIPGTIYDNIALMQGDPNYLSNLLAQDEVEKARLLEGNWKIRPSRGAIFNRYWYQIVQLEDIPKGGIMCRFWDFAATEKKLRIPGQQKENDPAFTAGVLLLYVYPRIYILDCISVQKGPADVDMLFETTAWEDWQYAHSIGAQYLLRWEEEGGASGIRDSYRLMSMVAGIDCAGVRPQGDKIVRGKPFAQQSRIGNVRLLEGHWNEAWLVHMHNQPMTKKKDIMDGTTGASIEVLNYAPFATATSHGR